MPIQNITINLDDAAYQAAVDRAQIEGRTLAAVVAEMLAHYAGNPSKPMLASYVVQRGDTLSRIARQIYGDPNQYPLIQRANNLADPGQIWVGQVLVIPAPAGSTVPAATLPPAPAPVVTPVAPTPVPVATPPGLQTPAAAPATPQPQVDPCAPIAGQSYGTLPIVGSPADRPAAQHGDLNLALRGYQKTTAVAGLIDMSGPTDQRAPQLAGLFSNKRAPEFSGVYRVNNWDWSRNARGNAITDFEVTLAGLKATPAEEICVPAADYSIGQGYAVLVLYAGPEGITLKYTGEDSVVSGYTIHLDGICVEPNLLALYDKMNAAGRRNLPALRAGQPLGRARTAEVRVAIRDTGRFMDPRVRKDWWRSR